MTYDSRPDTMQHIGGVRRRLTEVTTDIHKRWMHHDNSKLMQPELSIFNEFTPLLKTMTYGSKKYMNCLDKMQEGLVHHYACNDHHPEHFANGIHDMNLMQMIEMLCDWKAATMRHNDGDLRKSIKHNAKRFGYGNEIEHLLMSTADYFNWL